MTFKKFNYAKLMILLINLVLFIAVILFSKFVHKEGIKSFLIQLDRRGLNLFVEGSLIGILSFGLYVFLVLLLNEGQLIIQAEYILKTLKIFIAYSIAFLFASLFEESLYRGYVLQKLLKKLPLYVSIGISSVIFGLVHFDNYINTSHIFWLGIINVVITGAVLSIVVVKTQSLMWPIGWHLFWNLTQHLFLMENETVFSLILKKESIWTGSNFVPESGIITTIALLVLTFYITNFINTNDTKEDVDF